MAKKYLNVEWTQLIVHILAYYVVWFACIYSAAKTYYWLGFIVALVVTALQYVWQRFVKRQTLHLVIFLIYLTLIGVIGDSLLIYSDIIKFNANPFSPPFPPPFMMGIWLNFAMLFYALFLKYVSKPALVAGLSLIGFPLAYYVGTIQGAAILNNHIYALLAIGLFWSTLFTSSIVFFERFIKFPKVQS